MSWVRIRVVAIIGSPSKKTDLKRISTIPNRPVGIKFYKEKGIRTSETEALQKKMLVKEAIVNNRIVRCVCT